MRDNHSYEKEANSTNYTIDIPFFIGIIPTSEECLKKCIENFRKPEFEGFFWALNASINLRIENEKVHYTGIFFDNFDEHLTGKIVIKDRKTANNLKNLMVNLFTEGFDYPSGYKDIPNIFDKMEAVICQELEFSIDYGFELSKVRDGIKKTNVNNLYKD